MVSIRRAHLLFPNCQSPRAQEQIIYSSIDFTGERHNELPFPIFRMQ